jgi:hypothetical protein
MGFKKTSDTIAVSFSLVESAPNTFTQEEVALQLDVLNNEIFVVVAADLNILPPDAIETVNTDVRATVASTRMTFPQDLGQTNTIALARDFSQAANPGTAIVPYSTKAGEAVQGNVDYIALIATNNFFVAIEGKSNILAKSVTGRLWGYRARADASTYAALVQSEVLSA